jgi:hypothetical protein
MAVCAVVQSGEPNANPRLIDYPIEKAKRRAFQDEPKSFEVRLENAGTRTCVTVDWGDGNGLEFYGNLESCQVRYLTLTFLDVQPFDHVGKIITAVKTYP